EVDAFVVEGDAAPDGFRLPADVLVVDPGDVGNRLAVHHRRAVAGGALVGAFGHRLARDEEPGADIGRREVVPDGKGRLVQRFRPGRGGNHIAVDADFDPPRRREGVDLVVRVPGVDEHPLVLLEPGVDGVPVHHDVPLDVVVGLGWDVDVLGREEVAGKVAGFVDQL